jgi:lysophospholipase L1-like esterase
MKDSELKPKEEWQKRARLASVAALGLVLAACADGTGPTLTHSVEAYVFYDENGNLALDPSELARVPGVDVALGGRTGRSERRTGHVLIADVPEGQQAITVGHLPAYYGQKTSFNTNVPVTEPVLVPLQLDIGSNRPNVYMAFGDSITDGTGSSDGLGYRKKLQTGLVGYFSAGAVENEGIPGTRSAKGLARVSDTLAQHRPAYSLVLYGTNDWNDATCKWGNASCQTVEHLRDIVRAVRASGSLPVLATIIPCNPAYTSECPAERNDWLDQTNKSLRTMAQGEGVLVADLHAAFMAQPNLVALLSDHVHPNDVGYGIVADGFLRAVTGDASATTSATAAAAPFTPDETLSLLPVPAATPTATPGSAW